MHQQTNHQNVITMPLVVAKNLLFGQNYVETAIMLGPFFFDGNVNRQSYINLFNKVIPSITLLFQNQFYENQFQRLWWAQDGGPLPWVIGNSLKTKTTFWGKSLINLHNNKERSPRPPDLTPCDFFSLGLFKRKGFQNSSRKFECPTAKINN